VTGLRTREAEQDKNGDVDFLLNHLWVKLPMTAMMCNLSNPCYNSAVLTVQLDLDFRKITCSAHTPGAFRRSPEGILRQQDFCQATCTWISREEHWRNPRSPQRTACHFFLDRTESRCKERWSSKGPSIAERLPTQEMIHKILGVWEHAPVWREDL
jgi:hypothetical protein